VFIEKVMKKTRNIWVLFLIGFILVLSIVTVQATNPWSASASGAEKNTFKSLESIYIKSTPLCSDAAEVDVYIVENNDNWSEFDGETLEDVRGSPEPFSLTDSKITLESIWEKPVGGDYDIVVDCNKNGEYDHFIDQVDDFNKVGFSVESVSGAAKAVKGSKDIGDHTWRYDSEEVGFTSEILQIALTAEGEDIELFNMTVSASGNGDDTKISALEVYTDENNNGKLEDTETLIGSAEPAFQDDNGKTVVELDAFLADAETANFLIVYVLDDTLSEGEFSLKVESIEGIGANSEAEIKFSGLPISSGKMLVLSEKTCLGELNFELSPNPAAPGKKVAAVFSGLEGCDGTEVSLRTNPCGSSSPRMVGNCNLQNNTCQISFDVTSSLTYYACADKNEDNDSVDFGEFAFGDLVVKSLKEIANETEETEEIANETEESEENNESSGLEEITGNVVENVQQVSETSSFFILLEVTLLLILFVLVMILFRLKPPQPEKASNGKSTKKDKEKSEKED
jgi:hypothetical protein